MDILFIMLYSFCGALNIFAAINSFKTGHYILGGLNIMIVIWMVAMIFKVVIGG